jgi:hypothetical protein
VQEWRLLGGMLFLAAALSVLVKYVLPIWIRQPEPLVVWLPIAAPAALVALWLWAAGRKR